MSEPNPDRYLKRYYTAESVINHSARFQVDVGANRKARVQVPLGTSDIERARMDRDLVCGGLAAIVPRFGYTPSEFRRRRQLLNAALDKVEELVEKTGFVPEIPEFQEKKRKKRRKLDHRKPTGTDSGQQLLNIQQVATMLGVSTRTVERRVFTGKLTPIRTGRLVRFDRAAVMADLQLQNS